MLKDFRTYQLAVAYYRRCSQLRLPRHLCDQLDRASSSIALNIAEGSAKLTKKDQVKYYAISLGSLRECQSICELSLTHDAELTALADKLGGCLWVLCHGKSTSTEY